MTCERIEPELVAFHFGETDGALRDEIEAHLVSCPSCVRAFVGIKRAIETQQEAEARPSRAARDRLRRAVAREIAPEPARKWWERPVAFAVAASLVLAAGATTRAITSGPGTPPYQVARGP
jgi:hypothetical protein